MNTLRNFAFAALTVAAGPSGHALDLQVIEGRPVTAQVFIEGSGPFRFLIDTGAQTNTISEKAAARHHWRPDYAVELVSLQGVARRGAFTAARVAVGPVEAFAQEFMIATTEEMARLGLRVDGVLGQAFLSRFDYRLDLRGKMLTVGTPEPEGSRLPFEKSNGRMLIGTSQGRLILDSGAEAVILRRPARRAAAAGRLDTATGSVPVRTGRLDLAVGSRVFKNVTAAFAPSVKRDPLDPDGLLPLSLLGSIYVSNSQGFVVIEPVH